MSELFHKNYKILNPGQREAVDNIDGPVLVVAGPGTGKTQVLSLRIAKILLETDSSPSDILAITFTDNAAWNMRERLKEFIGLDAYKVEISTFHGFCNDIIQRFPEKFIFARELRPLDSLEQYKIMASLLDSHDHKLVYEKYNLEGLDEASKLTRESLIKTFSNPYFFQRYLLSSIDSLKREYISGDSFKQIIMDSLEELKITRKVNPRTGKPLTKWQSKLKKVLKNIEFLDVYEKYMGVLKKKGFYDFNDMIVFVNDALESDDELLGFVQEKYLYTMVDEYQDSNGAQNRLVQLIGSWDKSPNIFVVGDDDQSIFRFQGANLENILNFRDTYKSCKVISISTNYRSTQDILSAADSVIENNTERLVGKVNGLEKSLVAGREDLKNLDSKIKVACFENNTLESAYILKEIEDLISKGVDPEDIAIIYTKHKEGEVFKDILEKNNIPTHSALKFDLFNFEVIKQIVNLLRFIHNFNDEEILRDILFYDFFEFSRFNVFSFLSYAGKKVKQEESNLTLFDILVGKDVWKEVEFEGTEIPLESFGEKILKIKGLEKNHTFVDFVILLIEEAQISNFFLSKKDYDSLEAIKSLIEWIRSKNNKNLDYNLESFLLDLQIMSEAGISVPFKRVEMDSGKVNLLTAFASKGLEFEYVFIPKCIRGLWGGKRNVALFSLLDIFDHEEEVDVKEIQLEEERRLFFVALTRAKKSICITYAKEYISEDNNLKLATPSQFIDEIDMNHRKDLGDVSLEKSAIEKIIRLSIEPVKVMYSQIEKDFLKTKVENFRLSVSALNTYLMDPQNFLMDYIIKVPRESNVNLVLGSCIHLSLEYFFRQKMKGVDKEKDYVLNLFEKALAKETLSEVDREKVLKKGKILLADWFDFYGGEFEVPVMVEHRCSGVYLEDIPLVAKIDKVEWLDKESKTVKVIDYKTGSHKGKSQIIGDIRDPEKSYYRQLIFYKLITDLDKNFPYIVRMSELEFLKLKGGKVKKEGLEIENSDVEDMKKLIVEVMEKIRNFEF